MRPAVVHPSSSENSPHLATNSPLETLAPAWGLDIALAGDRDRATVFRLPHSSPLIRRWLFSRLSEFEAVSDSAIDNASTQSTTLYRADALARTENCPVKSRSCEDNMAMDSAKQYPEIPELPNPEDLPHLSCEKLERYRRLVAATKYGSSDRRRDISSVSSCSSCPSSLQSSCTSSESSTGQDSNSIKIGKPQDPTVRYFHSSLHGRIALKASLSSHWFLIPYENINGFLIGLGYCLVVYDQLDRSMSANALDQPCGRFAMDEETGEVFMTAFRPDGLVFVGWTQSISTCQRVRELFLFVAPKEDGQEPHQLVLRNSFYERRNCRMCGLSNQAETLAPPCSGAPRRKTSNPVDFTGFSFPDRRFRGDYFGICVKTLYDEKTRRRLRSQAIPILVDIRHASTMVDAALKQHLRQSVVTQYSFGPRSVLVDLIRPAAFLRNWYECMKASANPIDAIMERIDVNMPSSDDARGLKKSRKRQGIRKTGGNDFVSDITKDVQRVRNSDTLDRETLRHERVRRNRAAAQRANMERKRRIEATTAELADLKENILPRMRVRVKDLREENIKLKQLLGQPAAEESGRFHEDLLLPKSVAHLEWRPCTAEYPIEADFIDELFDTDPGQI